MLWKHLSLDACRLDTATTASATQHKFCNNLCR